MDVDDKWYILCLLRRKVQVHFVELHMLSSDIVHVKLDKKCKSTRNSRDSHLCLARVL